MNYTQVSSKQAYEWVKTGHWSLSDFDMWVARMTTELESWRHRFPRYVYRPQDECISLRPEVIFQD